MLDWDDVDRFSFEDSDRFEEDSMCSWSSEPESICNNWRGWKKPSNTNGNGNMSQNASHYGYGGGGGNKRSAAEGCNNDLASSATPKYPTTSGDHPSSSSSLDHHHHHQQQQRSSSHGPHHSQHQPSSNACQQHHQQVPQLAELAAKCVASHIPFELVENVYPPVPEQLQLRIAFWSFPDNEEDIRLYSCLANGSAEEFTRGELLYRTQNVKNPLQIGFHLSASVVSLPRMTTQKVAVTFDRRRISSCNCTCNPTAYWCAHVVAVCLTRIHWPHLVTLRAPVSESLSRLQRDQLQKFAQYLISELPQQILPTAQRLLDELLGSQPSVINSVCGAPDPTAGASATDQTTWYLDVKALHQNIKKILIKFCIPAPIVFSDVNYLSNSAPPAASEWTSLLRPLRGREPEGMWNLLSIVREMFKRNDRNAIPLLEIITDECLSLEQILLWWFNTKVALLNGTSNQPMYSTATSGSSNSGGGGKHNVNSNMHTSQHACSSLCDEIVVLWRLAALNPGLAPQERDVLHHQFTTWHLKVTERVSKCRGGGVSNAANNGTGSGTGGASTTAGSNKNGFKLDLEVFTGFKPAIEACYLDWDDYPMPGITYTQDCNPMYHCPFTCFKQSEKDKANAEGPHRVSQVNSSKAVLNGEQLPPGLASLAGRGMGGVGGRYIKHHHHGHHHHSRVTRFDFTQSQPSTSNNPSNLPLVVPVSTLNANAPSNCGPHLPLRSSEPSTSSAVSAHQHVSGNRSSVSSEGFCENDDDSASISISHQQQHLLNLHHMHRMMSLALASGGGGGAAQHVVDQVVVGGYDGNGGGRHHGGRHHRHSSRQQIMLGMYDGGVEGVEGGAGSDTSSGSSSGATNSGSSGGLVTDGGNGASDMVQITSDSASPSCPNTSSGSGSDSNNELEPKKESLTEINSLLNAASTSAIARNDDIADTSKERENSSTSSSHSSSPHSSEEFNTYFYNGQDLQNTIDTLPLPISNPIALPPSSSTTNNVQSTPDPPQFIQTPSTCNIATHTAPQQSQQQASSTDPWDVLFARAEGLHAHGHAREACRLSEQLAEELLAHPPDLMLDHHLPPVPRRKGKRQQVNPATHQLSCLASATLAKCAFLCSVLAENSLVMESNSHLAFRVGMFGLELARPPASTKPLEVKLANQESDLVALLKRIPLRHRELQILRDRATMLKDGTLKSRGEALLPLLLASFIFDALVMPGTSTNGSNGNGNGATYSGNVKVNVRLPTDEPLAFEAAVAALGLKANVSEAEHPLLCEGTRRQRSDLAIMLLLYYKDNCWKLARIMNRLLDREMHQMLKSPIMSSYYSRNPPIKSQYTHLKRDDSDKVMSPLATYLANSGGGSNIGSATGGGNGDMNSSGEMGCGSRPHSATSAELEQGMSNLSVASTSTGLTAAGGCVPTSLGTPGGANMGAGGTVTVITSTRTKEGRFKSKRAYPSIPNQPSEAGAHFFCELAKLVLTKAGGNMSTSLFTQPSANQNMHVAHRALHMCAFQLFLYALGLHNCVTPNWLSRTYSSHVSWITGQAMEIGAAAISFLIETWEGHLTPPEAASIADRASRGCDTNMVRAAAELALSVLPHAAALNANEIIRAILQCKEQSDVMLEHACLTVETAAKGGGVYPEVLFQVARYWYNLYVHHSPDGDQIMEQDIALLPPSASTAVAAAHEQHQQLHHSFVDGYGPTMMIDGAGAVYRTGPPMQMLNDEQIQQIQVQQQQQAMGDVQQIQQAQQQGMIPAGVQMIQGTGQIVTAPGVGQVVPVVPVQIAAQGPVVSSAVAAATAGVGTVSVVTSSQPPPPQFMPYAAYSFTLHHPHGVSYGGPIHPHHQLHHHPMHQPHHQMLPHHQHHHTDSLQMRGMQMAPAQPTQQVQAQPPPPPQQQPQPQHMQLYHLAGPPGPLPTQQNELPSHLLQQQAQVPPPPYVTYAQSGPPPQQQMQVQQQQQQQQVQSGQQSPQQVQLAGGPLPGPSVVQQQQSQQQQFQIQQQMQQQVQVNQVPQGQVTSNYPIQSTSGVAYPHPPVNQVSYPAPPPQQPQPMQFQQQPQQQQPVVAGYAPQGAAYVVGQLGQPGQPPPQQQPQLQYYGAAVTLAQPTRPTHMYPTSLPPPQSQPPPCGQQQPPQQLPLQPSQHHHHHGVAIPGPSPHQLQPVRHQQQLSAQQMRCLLAAYRVGMLAMETLARRVHDDRPQAKYARNPPYGEDVKWLLRISKHLGSQYLHQFCVCAVNSIVSPFVLHDVAVEAAQHLSRGSNPGLVLRTALSPLVQKCQQMYIQCMHQKLYHLSPQDYEDFVSIVCVARAAFQITPDGSAQFKEWLQNIKRSKSCKKELWSMINTALQANGK